MFRVVGGLTPGRVCARNTPAGTPEACYAHGEENRTPAADGLRQAADPAASPARCRPAGPRKAGNRPRRQASRSTPTRPTVSRAGTRQRQHSTTDTHGSDACSAPRKPQEAPGSSSATNRKRQRPRPARMTSSAGIMRPRWTAEDRRSLDPAHDPVIVIIYTFIRCYSNYRNCRNTVKHPLTFTIIYYIIVTVIETNTRPTDDSRPQRHTERHRARQSATE